jgi:effector-binding domain-containing protein
MNDADIHRQFESFANGDVQVGELPDWLHVHGKCAWYVYQGPYSGLGNAWQTFMGKVHAKGLQGPSPPGDLYVCDPGEHQADGGAKMMTVFWVPLW